MLRSMSPAAEFSLFALALMKGKGDIDRAKVFLDNLPSHLDAPKAKAYVAKAAVDPLTTNSGLSYTSMVGGFFEVLRSKLLFARMLDDRSLRRVPRRTRIVANTYAFVADAVSEGMPKPVNHLSLSGSDLPEFKAVGLVIVSDDLIERGDSSASNFLSVELRNAVVSGVDKIFLDTIAAGAPTIASSGSTGTAILDDLASMLAVVNLAGNAPYFAAGTDAMKTLAVAKTTDGVRAFPEVTLNGGELLGAPLVPCDQLAPGDLVLLNAAAFVGELETVELDASDEAAVQMVTDPATGAQQLVSLWQTDSRALKAETHFGFEQIQDDAVAVITDIVLPGQS